VSNNISEGHSAEAGHSSAADFRLLVLGSLGVVYGDIGTSPLYAFREAASFSIKDGVMLATDIYGLLSLIIWALILIVTIKYVLILLRIDNQGEGGILALMALARKSSGIWRKFVLGAGLLGTGLFFGDAAITPAISVMSAVEGLKVVSPALEHMVLPITIFILILLCLAQKHGTEIVSKFFGPVTALWFLALGGMGVYWIFHHPEVLMSFNPYYGLSFLAGHTGIAFAVLGAVFLAVTGAEALYADLGHFGRKPIQYAWLFMVFPCLVLNYLGQGALVLESDKVIDSPFFELVPSYLLLPLVGLATMATIIASQAVISGAFSLSRQAVLMGLLPRLEIRHTSANQKGQVYMPQVNRWLFFAAILLCFTFGSSSEMAAAYGISVVGTMIVGTFIAAFVMWNVLKVHPALVWIFLLTFASIEGVFLAANLTKVFEGGFVSLAIAGFVFLCIMIWLRATQYIRRKVRRTSMPLSDLLEQIERTPPTIIEGTAIYMASDPALAPLPMMQNLKHNKCFHKNNIVVNVVTSEFPIVPEAQRIVVQRVSSALTRIYIHYGFTETPDVPRALAVVKTQGLDIDLKGASYFIGHRTLISHPDRGLPPWQETIYMAMAKAATTPTDFYNLPRSRVIEIGMQVYI
jgi:KUP system potassium uptake protein